MQLLFMILLSLSSANYHCKEESEPKQLCCACNTAIYQMKINLEWTPMHHWTDYPGLNGDKSIFPHWSQIFGASHSPKFSLFAQGKIASNGVKDLCVNGSLRQLEDEFRKAENAREIATLIRTREINAFKDKKIEIRSAQLAVSKTHPMLSFLTRIVPSPDWCTGVTRLNLCSILSNCTWPQLYEMNLMPWDVGVFKGDTYIPRTLEPESSVMCPMKAVKARSLHPFTQSADDETIKRIGFIRLDLNRIIKNGECDIASINKPQIDDFSMFDRMENKCDSFLSWTSWSECYKVDHNKCLNESVKKYWRERPDQLVQFRKRFLPTRTFNCKNKNLEESRVCYNEVNSSEIPTLKHECLSIPKSKYNQINCTLPEWAQWLPCNGSSFTGTWYDQYDYNVTCNHAGVRFRYRDYKGEAYKKECIDKTSSTDIDFCFPHDQTDLQCTRSDMIDTCLDAVPLQGFDCRKVNDRSSSIWGYFYDPSKGDCQMRKIPRTCLMSTVTKPTRKNRNFFKTFGHCRRQCWGVRGNFDEGESRYSRNVKRPSSVEDRANRATICSQTVDTGLQCQEFFMSDRWYFNSKNYRCEQFRYQGCDGNANNFLTEQECNEFCRINKFS